jgi:glycerol-3-phosphate acyltransferase PlsY
MNDFVLTSWVITFLYGSIPFGLIFTKLISGKNIKLEGSGNIGATNVSRVVGFWPAGLLTFLFDFSKGFLPIVIFREQMSAFWENTSFFLDTSIPTYQNWILALSATLGHCFSPWLKLNGGKGVATAFGAISIISPIAASTGLVCYIVSFWLRKIGSLSSMIGLAATFGADIIITNRNALERLFFIVLLLLIVSRHESNLTLLLSESEKSFDSV